MRTVNEDTLTAIGALGAVVTGAGMGALAVKTLRTVQQLLRAGKKSEAERTLEAMQARERVQLDRWLEAQRRMATRETEEPMIDWSKSIPTTRIDVDWVQRNHGLVEAFEIQGAVLTVQARGCAIPLQFESAKLAHDFVTRPLFHLTPLVIDGAATVIGLDEADYLGEEIAWMQRAHAFAHLDEAAGPRVWPGSMQDVETARHAYSEAKRARAEAVRANAARRMRRQIAQPIPDLPQAPTFPYAFDADGDYLGLVIGGEAEVPPGAKVRWLTKADESLEEAEGSEHAGKSFDELTKPGEWNVKLRKAQRTRWGFFVENPQGGGSGVNTSVTSAPKLLAHVLGRVPVGAQAGDKVWVIIGQKDGDPSIAARAYYTTWGSVGESLDEARNDYGKLAQDLIRVVGDAKATQARFLKTKGLTIEQARKLTKAEQATLQRDYTEWLKTNESLDEARVNGWKIDDDGHSITLADPEGAEWDVDEIELDRNNRRIADLKAYAVGDDTLWITARDLPRTVQTALVSVYRSALERNIPEESIDEMMADDKRVAAQASEVLDRLEKIQAQWAAKEQAYRDAKQAEQEAYYATTKRLGVDKYLDLPGAERVAVDARRAPLEKIRRDADAFWDEKAEPIVKELEAVLQTASTPLVDPQWSNVYRAYGSLSDPYRKVDIEHLRKDLKTMHLQTKGRAFYDKTVRGREKQAATAIKDGDFFALPQGTDAGYYAVVKGTAKRTQITARNLKTGAEIKVRREQVIPMSREEVTRGMRLHALRLAAEESIDEVSPPGFKGTVKAMKRHAEIDNPYALSWWMKKRGARSTYKADGTKKKAESIDEANYFKQMLGLEPMDPPRVVECPACHERNAYWHEAHADTGMDEFVIRCPDCGADTTDEARRDNRRDQLFAAYARTDDTVKRLAAKGDIGSRLIDAYTKAVKAMAKGDADTAFTLMRKVQDMLDDDGPAWQAGDRPESIDEETKKEWLARQPKAQVMPGSEASFARFQAAGAAKKASKKKGKGRWVTTDSGHRIYIEGGKVTKGNPHVLKALKQESAEQLLAYLDGPDASKALRAIGPRNAPNVTRWLQRALPGFEADPLDMQDELGVDDLYDADSYVVRIHGNVFTVLVGPELVAVYRGEVSQSVGEAVVATGEDAVEPPGLRQTENVEHSCLACRYSLTELEGDMRAPPLDRVHCGRFGFQPLAREVCDDWDYPIEFRRRGQADEAEALDLSKFERMGREAFQAGRTATPAHDRELMAEMRKLLKGKPTGVSIAIMDAWSKGWHRANAEQKVEAVDAPAAVRKILIQNPDRYFDTHKLAMAAHVTDGEALVAASELVAQGTAEFKRGAGYRLAGSDGMPTHYRKPRVLNQRTHDFSQADSERTRKHRQRTHMSEADPDSDFAVVRGSGDDLEYWTGDDWSPDASKAQRFDTQDDSDAEAEKLRDADESVASVCLDALETTTSAGVGGLRATPLGQPCPSRRVGSVPSVFAPDACPDEDEADVDEARKPKKSNKLRDQDEPEVFGYKLDRESLTPRRNVIDTSAPGDYGSDPLGDGKFRMVPSGDIVDFEERNRRLKRKNESMGVGDTSIEVAKRGSKWYVTHPDSRELSFPDRTSAITHAEALARREHYAVVVTLGEALDEKLTDFQIDVTFEGGQYVVAFPELRGPDASGYRSDYRFPNLDSALTFARPEAVRQNFIIVVWNVAPGETPAPSVGSGMVVDVGAQAAGGARGALPSPQGAPTPVLIPESKLETFVLAAQALGLPMDTSIDYAAGHFTLTLPAKQAERVRELVLA